MKKQDLALNNQQWLICCKIQTKPTNYDLEERQLMKTNL